MNRVQKVELALGIIPNRASFTHSGIYYVYIASRGKWFVTTPEGEENAPKFKLKSMEPDEKLLKLYIRSLERKKRKKT